MSSSAWATSTTYYAKLTVGTSGNSPTGAGTVYASTEANATSGKSSVVGSASSDGDSATVTIYGFANANIGYKFLGWSESSDGSKPMGGERYDYSVESSDKNKNPTIGKEIYGVFAYETYDPFTISFVPAPTGCSYTVNEGDPVDIVGCTHVTEVRLATSDSTFVHWRIGDEIVENPIHTVQCTGPTKIEGVFLTEDNTVSVATETELIDALANPKYIKIEIPKGVAIPLESGKEVTVLEGATLLVNGDLTVSGLIYANGNIENNGTIDGSGTIVVFTKHITQIGNGDGDAPIETNCLLSEYNKKYYKTIISDLSTTNLSGGKPTCNLQYGAKVVRNGAIVAQCGWPSNVTPAVLCCTVDPNKAVNCITGFLNPCYDADAAKGMATMKNNGQQTKQMLVLLATKTLNNTTCSNAGLLVQIGKYNKLQGNFGTMDLAGSTLTMSPSYIDNYTHTLLNGGLSVTTLMYSGTLNCINLSSLSLSKLKEDYASVVNIYDCTPGYKVPKSYDGTNTNKNKVNFYSSGDNSYSTSSNFHTQNPTSVYKIYGGIWNGNPGNDYNGAGNDYGFYPTSEGASTYSLQLKTDKTVVKFDDGTEFDSLDAAFAALSTMSASSVKMTMVKNAALAKVATIPAGKTVEMELDGCCITASNGFVINNGTFLIGDRRGNIAADGGRVITSSGNFLVNNGAAEITYGYYTGNINLTGGKLITHHGYFAGAVTAADKSYADLRGGRFAKDVSSVLQDGYYLTSGYVGPFPKPVVSKEWVSSYGGYWNYSMKTLSADDLELYNNASNVKDDYTGAKWARRAEVMSMVTPWLNYTIDIGVGFDRNIKEGGATARVTKPVSISQALDSDVGAGEFYRVFSPYFVQLGTSQKRYSNFLVKGSGFEQFQDTIFGISTTTEGNYGTVANLRIELCTGDAPNLTSYRALMSEYAVLGAGETNQAMIQPKSGAATFYATIADAVAVCPEGGTIKLCNNIDSTDAITISKAVTIDTNGMEFKGTFKPGTNYKMTSKETVLDIEKYLGKKRCIYTFELDAIPFTLLEDEKATVTADPESPVTPNTEVTVTVTPKDGYFFVDGSSSKSFNVTITTAGQQVKIPDDMDIMIKKAYVPTDQKEITIKLPTGDAPVKVTENLITKMKTLGVISSATPTAAEVSAGLNTKQANELTVWQNIVMGVDGTEKENEFATIGKKGVKVIEGKEVEIIVVKTPIVAFDPKGDMNVTVTYTLLKKGANDAEWVTEPEQEGLSIPAVDIVPSKLEVGDVLWKFEAVFKTSGGE